MSESVLTEEHISTASRPSALRITDLRVATLTGVPFRSSIIRLDTNQGLVGYGEVRDGASAGYALMLKSRVVGENPCNVDKVFRKIKQFGHHARQGGGVSGIEMALMDLAGKAYGVPAYALLGGQFRDRVRCYADTPSTRSSSASTPTRGRRSCSPTPAAGTTSSATTGSGADRCGS
jgi:L-alanine-DL-glutamate epimerase-like enolase superfamily enzyme